MKNKNNKYNKNNKVFVLLVICIISIAIIMVLTTFPIFCFVCKYKTEKFSISYFAHIFNKDIILSYYGTIMVVIVTIFNSLVTIYITYKNINLSKENTLLNKRLDKFPNIQLCYEKDKKGKIIYFIQNNSDNTAFKVRCGGRILKDKLLPGEEYDFQLKNKELKDKIILKYSDSINSNIEVTYFYKNTKDYIADRPKYSKKYSLLI